MSRILRVGLACVAALLVVSTSSAQIVAYDEFDGAASGGWAQEGLGEWKIAGAREESGSFVTTVGDQFRALAHPVKRAVVWYAVTMRMRSPIVGYASIVPSATNSSQFSELGFNSTRKTQNGLWTASGGQIDTKIDACTKQTFLQRYDLANRRWSAWCVEGNGAKLVDRAGNVVAEPMIKDAELGFDTLAYVYLTKSSPQELEVQRIVLAASAKEALMPVKPGTETAELPQAPDEPLSPALTALTADSSPLAIGERIDFFGDSITWQGGYVDMLEKALAEHAQTRHVTLMRRGLNGALSTDLRDGVKNLFGQDQGALADVAKADQPTIVSIFIGINDVWRGEQGNPPKEFESALRSLVKAASQDHRRVVLSTPTLIGEKPLGANPFDKELDRYAEIVRTVASSEHATLCDLHRIFVEWIAAHNPNGLEKGLLTYDGVHMLPQGNALIADAMADALMRAAAVTEPTSDFGLVPMPRAIDSGGGLTNFPEVRICAQDLPLVPIADELAEELRVLGAPQVRVVARGANVNLRIEPALDTRGEFHRVTIRDGSIDIVSSDPRGVSRGTATLIQAAEVRDDALVLPKLSIYDGPDTEFRALMIDVARKPHPLVVLKQCVELCRYYKLAYLQLHLTDDQAFTFPSKAYERLVTPGQHYTQDELRTLVAFASARGVTIVPEIEMPGHGAQIVARMPETFRISEEQTSTIDFANPDAVRALEILLGEVADVFKDSPYIHIGGDETDFNGTQENAHFQAAFQREHVDDADELYRKFIGHMNDVVKSLGKRTLVWEGFRPGGKVAIPRDLIVVGYESAYYTPDALVRDGFTVVNAAWKPLYVVNERNWSPREIYGWNRLLWQHFIDGFPAFGGIQLAPTDKVLGAMMCAWEQPAALELSSLKARVPAMSERLWQPKLRAGYDDFERRRGAADLKLVKLLAAIH